MKEYYKHTQTGYLVMVAAISALFLFIAIAFNEEYSYLLWVFMFLIMFLLLSFISLNVVIDEKYLRIKFGYGMFRKKFLLNEIVSVKTVKNRWYYGWGIRIWFWPKMFIYNVSGFDAVEIVMKNGKIYRIGTDEPKKLEAEIVKYLTVAI